MNSRERMLAMIVGGLLFVVVGFFFQSWVFGRFAVRQGQIDSLERKLKNVKQQVLAGQRAERALVSYQERSLPPDATLARSLYQNWLLAEVEKAGFDEPKVAFASETKSGNLYVNQKFTASGAATLPEVVDLLHAFYSVDWLHRVTDLSIVPIEDSKLLEVSITAEAISLAKAKPATQLVPRPGKRLALPSREDYARTIVDRNLFGPPNEAPRLAVSGSKDVNTGRSAELTLKASDSNPHDTFTYRMVEADAEDARFDPRTGRFSWTPRKPGRYTFEFEAVDDGYPSKTSRPERIVLNVTDAAPRASAPPPPSFDHARYTVLTAVLDVSGQQEVWLHVRPTGQTLKLHEGDQFQIGSVKGTVAEIGDIDFTLESDGQRRRISKGEMLQTSAQSAASDTQ